MGVGGGGGRGGWGSGGVGVGGGGGVGGGLMLSVLLTYHLSLYNKLPMFPPLPLELVGVVGAS